MAHTVATRVGVMSAGGARNVMDTANHASSSQFLESGGLCEVNLHIISLTPSALAGRKYDLNSKKIR